MLDHFNHSMSAESLGEVDFERRWGDSKMVQFLRDHALPSELEKGSITNILLPCDSLSQDGDGEQQSDAGRDNMRLQVIEQVLDYG